MVYCYTLFEPLHPTPNTAKEPVNHSIGYPSYLSSSTDTESETSQHEDNFDPTTFFDFPSYDYHHPVATPQFHYPVVPAMGHFQMYPVPPYQSMFFPSSQAIQAPQPPPPPPPALPQRQTSPPPQYTQPRTTQQIRFEQVIYSTSDIHNHLNKRKRIPKGPRSETGCFICRLRHLKCDERKPRCIRCDMIGMGCEYPERKKPKPLYMICEDTKRRKLEEIRSHTRPKR